MDKNKMGTSNKEIFSEKSSEVTETVQTKEENILRLTKVAANKVKEIMQSEGVPSSAALRIAVQGGGCAGFVYDISFDGGDSKLVDKVITSQGIDLIVDQMSLMYLTGTIIDYVEGLQGSGFSFNNPLVSNTCGCGKSFSA